MDTKKPYRITTKKQIRKARTKLILWISFSLVKYELLKKIIKEFKKRGIFENHRLYIKMWLSYLNQKEFSEKSKRQMLGEIKRYLATRDNKCKDKIIEVIWNETDTEAWIIIVPK